MTDISTLIIEALRKVISAEKGRVSLHEPLFTGNEKIYLADCIDSGWVSSVGKYVERFEEMLAQFTGTKRAIAVANGTLALHTCLLLAGVKPDDEVLAPTLTFVATANAISHCGAIAHFVDSSYATLGMDPFALADYLKDIVKIENGAAVNRLTGRRIAAILPMHTFGHPVDMDPLMETAQRYKIPVVEDAAESLGSYYKGVHAGNAGIVASLSFNGNKTITTGGGGAIITNDENLAKLAKHITTTAKLPHKWAFVHDMVAYNYRMPNLNAALGCAQMENFEKFLAMKRTLTERYIKAFEPIRDTAALFTEPQNCKSNYWLNAIILSEDAKQHRNQILDDTNEQGLMTRPSWTLMHKLPMYKDCPRMSLTVAEDLEARIINIPSSQGLASS